MNLEKEQLALFHDFVSREKEKEDDQDNCLSLILEKLMSERKITLSQIHIQTGIAWSTLQDMKSKKNDYQKLNKNILKLAKFFNVSIQYLCFGVGSDEPVNYNKEDL